jgi:hypothetical protein
MDRIAPIVLFVYNRLEHIKKTVEALQMSKLAKDSELFIYSDAHRNADDRMKIDEVRKYIESIDGFKKVTVIKREKNWGLADSIVDGVTKIVNEYGRVIVLEDDILTSPFFLEYMNDALEFYKNEKKVWHISGWNYPIETDELKDVFLWRLMNCWGWATWDDRWKYYEKDTNKSIKNFSKEDIKFFNIDGVEDFFGQVVANHEKKINTWAIFWYTTIFQKNGLCLNPSQTFVENIGLDGTGVHCGEEYDVFKSVLCQKQNIRFNINIKENRVALEKIQDFYRSKKKNLITRIINKISLKRKGTITS